MQQKNSLTLAKKSIHQECWACSRLQGAVTKDLEFYVFDVSPRVPGCPCVEPTSPYMKYKYGMEVGPGRRVAMEVKRAVKEGRLAEVVT